MLELLLLTTMGLMSVVGGMKPGFLNRRSRRAQGADQVPKASSPATQASAPATQASASSSGAPGSASPGESYSYVDVMGLGRTVEAPGWMAQKMRQLDELEKRDNSRNLEAKIALKGGLTSEMARNVLANHEAEASLYPPGKKLLTEELLDTLRVAASQDLKPETKK